MNKTIEDRAHEILLKLIETDKTGFDTEGIAGYAYEIAEAMQAEAEKRKHIPDARSLTKDGNGNCLHLHHEFGHKKCMDCGACLKEWQPDWSQAPEDAYEWEMVSSDEARWVCEIMVGIDYEEAPTFKYQGNWKDSLRKRP